MQVSVGVELEEAGRRQLAHPHALTARCVMLDATASAARAIVVRGVAHQVTGNWRSP